LRRLYHFVIAVESKTGRNDLIRKRIGSACRFAIACKVHAILALWLNPLGKEIEHIMAKKRPTNKSRSKGKRRTGKKFRSKPEKKSRLPELEAQYSELMARTRDSQNPLIRENARVLAERMDQFKAGKIKAAQVKATIDIQMQTIQALAATTPTPGGDKTPNLHETDLALKLLEIGLKLLL
jgi:hypothetical protein